VADARPRYSLLRWLSWFTAANAGCVVLVSGRYLWQYDWPAGMLGIAYPIVALVGQSAFLALVWVYLPAAGLVAVWPQRRAVIGLAVVMAAAMLAFLVLDANVFAEYRYHVDPLTAALFEPATWLATALQFLILLVFETFLARLLAGWVGRRAPGWAGWWLGAGLVTCWLAAQGIYAWADAVFYVPVTQFTRYLPLYYPLQAERRLARLHLIEPGSLRVERQLQRLDAAAAAAQLRYPLAPLSCDSGRALNLMVLLIDGLRPDVVHPQLMPALVGLSAESLVFRNHWSGGNSSRMGIFSLAYGVPSTYWQAFDGVQQPPVLMEELHRRGYALALSSAVGFGSPAEIDRTMFSGVPNLPESHDGSGAENNRAVTRTWLQWVDGRDVREPFFAFLYYAPPIQDMPGKASGPLALDDRHAPPDPLARYWLQYRRAARFVDDEVAKVVASLRARNLWDQTVLIVTSDHGYEFDDTGLGYVGYATAFTPYQLRTPLVIHWPGKPAAEFTHRTSHYDLAPTLLGDLLGCTTDPADYSVGQSLFSGRSWPWLIAGSYNSYAIVADDSIIVSQHGLVEVRDSDYRPGGRLDRGVVSDAMSLMRRFYR